jgi:hypothetical protein
VNGLFWGLDNWVYGANGRSDGEIRQIPLKAVFIPKEHDFRFRPDSGEIEAIAGQASSVWRRMTGAIVSCPGIRSLSGMGIPRAMRESLHSLSGRKSPMSYLRKTRRSLSTHPALWFSIMNPRHFSKLAGSDFPRRRSGNKISERFVGESLPIWCIAGCWLEWT